VTISAPRAAGDRTAPSPATARTGDPARRRMAHATVHQDTEDPCAREVRFSIDVKAETNRVEMLIYDSRQTEPQVSELL